MAGGEENVVVILVPGGLSTCRNIANVDHQFEVPYDILVFAVGAINNTFNIPGVQENAFFLKVRRGNATPRRRSRDRLGFGGVHIALCCLCCYQGPLCIRSREVARWGRDEEEKRLGGGVERWSGEEEWRSD